MHYFVFLLEHLACHLITKICKRLAHPSLFDAKKFIFFKIFLLFFFEFTTHNVHFKVFRLTRAAGMSNLCQNLHAPCSLEYLRSHKISDFFEFFCYFFRIYCSSGVLFTRGQNWVDSAARTKSDRF